MKILKTLFNRVAIVTLAIIIQACLIIYGLTYISVYLPVKIIETIIAAIVFLVIINKSETPESKIPWLVVVIAFPVAGASLYILFANHHMTKKQSIRYKKILEEAALNYKRNLSLDELKEITPKWAGDIKYIEDSSKLYACTKSKTKYFPSGKVFMDDLLTELSKAKEFIFIQYFIIEKGVFLNSVLDILKKKVEEGVEVRFLYDDIGSSSKVPSNYYKKIRALGIKCYKSNPFIPIVSGIANNRNHRKSVIIDGVIAYTGGVNIADEYIDVKHPFGKWKDNSIRIEGQAVDNLTIMFLTNYSYDARIEEDYGKYLHRYTPYNGSGIVLPFADGPKPLYNEQIGENVYLNIINKAEKYVYMTTPYLIVDHILMNALCNAAKRGVDVRIITPHIPDKKFVFQMTRSSYKELITSGVKIYEYTPGFMHAKMFISDDNVAVVGTINLDYRSLIHNYENAVFLYNNDAIKDIGLDFEEIFNDSMFINENPIRINAFMRLLISIAKLFQVVF